MSNSKGSYRTTWERAMAAYDALPREVRVVLANSIGNWVAQPLLTKLRRKGYSTKDAVNVVTYWNMTSAAQYRRLIVRLAAGAVWQRPREQPSRPAQASR